MGRYGIGDEAVDHVSRRASAFSEFIDDVLCQVALAAGRWPKDPKILHACFIALPVFELAPILDPITGVRGRLFAQGLRMKLV